MTTPPEGSDQERPAVDRCRLSRSGVGGSGDTPKDWPGVSRPIPPHVFDELHSIFRGNSPNMGSTSWESVKAACPPWAQDVVLAGYRGSESHGTSIFNGELATDDVDVFAISVQPESWYVGLSGYANSSRQHHETAGDHLDLLVYDVRKFFSLLAAGNPNVHVALWLEPEHYLFASEAGNAIVESRRIFMSRSMLDALCGYAIAQFKKMERNVYRGYMGEKRKLIADKFGYDVKNAAHCLRLIYMGIELCQDGTLHSYRPAKERELLMEVKTGQWSLEQVKTWADALWKRYRSVESDADLPDFPDFDAHQPFARRSDSFHPISGESVKATIEVKDRGEAAAVKAALNDPVTRAFVLTMGALLQLPSDRSRKRVLQFVQDHLAENGQDGAPSE